MIAESLCDRCISPGACCKKIFLSGGGPSASGHRISDPMSFERAERMALEKGLWMFHPAHQQENGTWQFSCSALDRNGRCSIYAERPDLCRRYRPGQDGLCVHYWPDPHTIADQLTDLAAECEPLDLAESGATNEQGESEC
jgi:Fe-S-cluster containining protein